MSSSSIKLFYNDVYEVELPSSHRFPMKKYKMVREKLVHFNQNLPRVEFQVSPLATRDELLSTHCPKYVDRYLSGTMTTEEIRRAGFPWSEGQVLRSLSSVGGTLAATRFVLENEKRMFSCHIAGGTHHAFYDYGEGFCIFNDIAVACNVALKEFRDKIQKIAIIDLDVHQGNGNAVLFANDPRVFTFSMHCKENYFSKKQSSNVDIELDVGTEDDQYISTLKVWLPYIIDVVKPQLVFFQAGVDVHHADRLGKLKLTNEGVRRRNQLIFDYLHRKNIKCVVTMGGGYPRDLNPTSESFTTLVNCHFDVYQSCIEKSLAS